MSNAETLNQYIKELFDYWDGKNDDFEPIPIPKEVDDEMQADQAPFYVSRSIRYRQNASERISESVQTKRWRTSTSLS